MTPQPTIRAGVVGAGFVGQIHARALASHPAVELVGVAGRGSGRAQVLAARHGVPAFGSTAELVSAQAPALVCIATGNDDHLEPTLAALEGGANVFCEKPLAFRLEEAQTLVRTASDRGLQLAVDFNHRFSEPYRRALAFLDAGRLGTLAYVDCKFAGDLYKELNDPYCMLIETQGHSFDLMRRIAGEVAEVSAFLADPRGIGVYTSAAIALRFESGAVGSLLGSWDSSYAQPASQLLEAAGIDGRLVVDNVVDAVRLYRRDDPAVTEWRPGIFDAERHDFWRTIDAHVHAVCDALLQGQAPPVTGVDGLRALELTDAAARSFETRGPVGLEPR